MIINRIEVLDHEYLKSGAICFKATPSWYPFNFKNQIIAFIGANGAGKTSLASLIAEIFFNLDRRQNSIKAHLIIEYTLDDGIDVKFEYIRGRYFIKMNGIQKEIKSIKDKVINSNTEMSFNSAKKYLPGKVITSAFSTRGEYEHNRSANYGGDNLVSYAPVSSIYGKNHHDYTSVSSALIRLIRDSSKMSMYKSALDLVGYKLSGTMRVRHFVESILNDYPDEVRGHDDSGNDIVKISNRNLISIIEETKNNFYINSFDMKKGNVDIAFSYLSSGETFFILRLLGILSLVEKNSIIIIEEPEMHLNQNWVSMFLPSISAILEVYNVSIICITHNNEVVRIVPSFNVVMFDKLRFSNCEELHFMSDNLKIQPDMRARIDMQFLESIKSKSKVEKQIIAKNMAPSFLRMVLNNETT